MRKIATWTMVLLYFAIPAAMWAARNGHGEVASVLGWVAMPWMVVIGLSAVWHGALEVVRLGRWGWRRLRRGDAALAPEDPSRRVFLARAAAGTAMVASAASISAGMVSARGEHEIVTVEVPIPRLPKHLDGFTIAQLTDLHVGLTIDAEFVGRVVERTNAIAPDLIVLTGDLVDGAVEDLRGDAAPLAGLRAKHGVFAVTGNHEYYSGADAWIAELTKLGVRYLRNQRVSIGDEAASFDLAGVDDHSAHRWEGHGADLKAALAGRDGSRALVLLAHQPRQVRVSVAHDVDLQLSGHTHGGQVWPWHYVAKAQQGGLLAGLYERERADRQTTRVYVSRGCGYFGPPVRVGAPLEISRIVLRAA